MTTMRMSVVCMTEGGYANQIDGESEAADGE